MSTKWGFMAAYGLAKSTLGLHAMHAHALVELAGAPHGACHARRYPFGGGTRGETATRLDLDQTGVPVRLWTWKDHPWASCYA